MIRQIHLGEERLTRGLFDKAAAPLPRVDSALLRRSPEDIGRKFGVRFEASWDDLDHLEIALLQIDGGPQFALVRHRGAPVDGTEVWLHPEEWNRPGVLEAVLTELDVPPGDVLWRLPGDFTGSSPSRPEENA